MSRLLISAVVGVLSLSSAALAQVEIKYAPEAGTVLRRNFEVKHFLAVKRSVTKMGELEQIGQRTFDMRNVETMQSAGFLWLFPLTFVSSAFVPVESMHSFVQGFAEQNPVTISVNAVRGLALGEPDAANIVKTLVWTAALTVVAAVAAVNRYRKV